MGAESLKDVLSKVPGLTLQFGTFPSASSKSKSSISIRGMGANGTLFLLDGRRLSGEVKNPFDLDRIPASTIERIEVVKGSMSSLYGADAVGGVINIITKKAGLKPEINLGIRYGQNSQGKAKNKNAYLDIKGAKNKFKYSVYVNKTKTTPYIQNELASVMVKQAGGPNNGTNQKPSNLTPGTPSFALNGLADTYSHDVTYTEDSDVNTIGTRLSYDFNDDTTVGLDLNAFTEKREGSYIGYFHPSNARTPIGSKIPVFNIPVNTKDDNTRIDVGLDLSTNINEDLLLKLRAYKSYYKKRNTTTAKYYSQMGYSSEAESASNGMNANVDIRTYEALINYSLNDNHFLTTGIEKRDENREASVFTKTSEMTKKSVNYKAIYLQDEWQINDSLNAIIGARYDEVSNADNKATFRLGLVNSFSNLFNLRANFAQGYRTPDIREMYINKQTPNGLQQGANVIGYDLKPEFTNSYELGLSGRTNNFSYTTAIFLNEIEDKISQVNTGSYYTFQNLSKAETKGLELSFKYNFTNDLSSAFSWTELRTENKTTKKELEFNPNRTLALNLDYKLTPNLLIGTKASYIGKQYYVKNNTENMTNAYTLVDMNANYKINNTFTVYAGVNNIFDKKVDDILGSNVGTYYFSGLRAKF
jgi:outer membrane receptor for ferrienterochelin and colicins